jgi:nucleotide-binding universal stress UspA family protein
MKVMLALNGISPCGEVVKAVAARPWPSGSSFCLLNVLDPYPFVRTPALLERAKACVRKNLESAAGCLRERGESATTEIVLGNPRRGINAVAADWHADLVMVGSNELRDWERLMLGSTARSVLRHAPCSVEIVRPARGERAAEIKQGMKILFATDGSESSMVALRSMAQRPWPAGSEIRVISVPEFLPLKEFFYLNAREAEDLGRASEEEAAICAAKGVEILSGSPLSKVSANVPVMREPAFQVILDEAEKWKADMIVLGSHGRSGFDRMVMGSVSESVALHAGCSVEVVRRPHDFPGATKFIC